QSLPAGNARNNMLGNIFQTWVQQDQAAAMEYIQGLPKGKDRDRILQSSIGMLAYQDPKLASTLAAMLPPGQAINNIVSQIANGFVNNGDTKSALDWIKTLPAGRARNNAM